MKKKVLIAALFLVAYLGFLLVKLPATLVVRHLPLPPNLVQLEGVSGTLWSGQVARLQPQGQELQVWIDTVAFDDLLIWLATLADRHGVQVQVIEVARENLAPGLVKVRRLQLSRPQ